MAESVGAAWQRVADAVAPSLPGTWVRRRTGAKATVVREPIEWTVPWIGFSRSRGTDYGYVYAAVAPLTQPFQWVLTYGLRMGDDRRYSDLPVAFPVLDPDAPAILSRFLDEQGLPTIDEWSAARLAEVAERSYARPAGERDRPIAHWTQAPGWRVVNDTGSPVDPSRDAIDYFGQGGPPDRADWYRQLVAAWEAGGRAAALDFLVDYKQQVLTREKLVS